MKKTRHTEEEMKIIYANWQQSGMNKTAYCQQIGIPHATFFYWIKKLSAKGPVPAPEFMELDLLLTSKVLRISFLKLNILPEPD